MSPKSIRAFLASVGTGAIALIATHGKAFLEAVAAVPEVLAAWTKGTPVGAWAVLAGLLLPVLVMLTVERWVPETPGQERKRRALMELGGIGVAVFVSFMLMPRVSGLLIGLLCGLVAPWITRGVVSTARWIKKPEA